MAICNDVGIHGLHINHLVCFKYVAVVRHFQLVATGCTSEELCACMLRQLTRIYLAGLVQMLVCMSGDCGRD